MGKEEPDVHHGHQETGAAQAEVRLAMGGYPPKKNEAISLFSTRHPDHRNVVELLREAQRT